MTRDEIAIYVRERLSIAGSDTAATTQIRTLINNEYQGLVAYHQLKVDRAELAITEDDPLVDLPDDWLETIRIRFGSYVLELITRQELFRREADRVATTVESGPRAYCFEPPSRIRVEPPPASDDDDGLVIDYVVQPATLGSSDEPEWVPKPYHDVIAEKVIVAMAMSEEELGISQAAQARAMERERQLVSFLTRRQGHKDLKRTIRGQLARS